MSVIHVDQLPGNDTGGHTSGSQSESAKGHGNQPEFDLTYRIGTPRCAEHGRQDRCDQIAGRSAHCSGCRRDPAREYEYACKFCGAASACLVGGTLQQRSCRQQKRVHVTMLLAEISVDEVLFYSVSLGSALLRSLNGWIWRNLLIQWACHSNGGRRRRTCAEMLSYRFLERVTFSSCNL